MNLLRRPLGFNVLRRFVASVMQRLCVALLTLGTFNAALAVTCPSNPDSAYFVHDDGTVTDLRTGLRWKVCSEGLTWEKGVVPPPQPGEPPKLREDRCVGDVNAVPMYTGAQALGLAQASNYAGIGGWRVPQIWELHSLFDFVCPVNSSIFPSLLGNWYLSGTPGAFNSTRFWAAWVANRDPPHPLPIGYVRLVRGSFASATVQAVLPASDASTARVMRGGRGYRWFQVRDGYGTPLPGAGIYYRNARGGNFVGATTEQATTDANGLFVVSTPPLDDAGLGQAATPLGQSIVFNLAIDAVQRPDYLFTPVGLPFVASPFTYVVAARNLEQKWNVGKTRALTASVGNQVGIGFKVGPLGARARAGYGVSGTQERSLSLGSTHNVNNYGEFEVAGYDYELSTRQNGLSLSVDEELTAKAGASLEISAGIRAGLGRPGHYVGVGPDAEISGTFGESVTYSFPAFFAPSTAEQCVMGWGMLNLSSHTPPFIANSSSSSVCGVGIATYLSNQATKLAVAATVGPSLFASTRLLNMVRKDRDFGQHFSFGGVGGDVVGVYERDVDVATQGSRVTKTLFAKGSAGVALSQFSEMRGKARGAEKILRSTTFGLTPASVGEHAKRSLFGNDSVATSVAFSTKSAEIKKENPEFGSFSMPDEEEVAEITTVHTRIAADAQALSDGWMNSDIEFSRSPIVTPVEQALQTSTGLGGGFTAAPGYYVERTATSTAIEFPIEFELAGWVGLGLSFTFSAEAVTNSLSERGRVASFLSPSGQQMYAPLKTESYVADGELAGLRRSWTDVSASIKAVLQSWISSKITSIGAAIDAGVRSVSFAASELRAQAGTYLSGWRFVLTKENAGASPQSKLSALLLNGSTSAVVGQVHFVNLLSPTNEDVDAFPDPVNLTIGNVLASLGASGLASSDASSLVLVRIDRASGKTVVVPGALGAGGDSYVAAIQQRGAYFLVYDRTPPSLTLLVASTTSNAPKTVTVTGAFDGSDLTGLNPATFSVLVDGIEQGAPVSGVSKINSTTGEFEVPVTSGAWTSGGVSRLQVRIADGAGNISLTSRCAFPTGNDMALLPSTSATCSALATGAVNITASAAPDRQTDAVLLARYLLGFRGGALTSGLTLTGTRTLPAEIEAFIGDARVFDVVARDPADSPRAMVDALILLRLAQGFADAQLLEGIAVPTGAGLTTAAGVRAFVNLKFGTNY
jgi:Protein of unknown function (DUF1566)